jgi:2-oxoisovalerate dehydrogenase E1 component beta subunit
MPTVTYLEAISEALREEMERDERVLILGEDIAVFGGAFKVTRGFLEKFGADRVIDTPIAESGFTGMACGMAVDGLRPVVEFQFMDFITCAFDQIVNYAAKVHYRWGYACPVVLRGPAGAGVRGGPYHSISPEAWFAHVPGIKVAYPATPYDAKGLLKAAIRDDNPVLFLEHKRLYRKVREEIPEEDYVVPLGEAEVKIPGRDLTIVTYGAMLHESARAAQELADEGVEAEVVDVRTMVPFDADTVMASVARTGRALVVTEEHRTAGFGAEIAARIAEECFESLDAPVLRMGALDVPHPFSPVLEDAMLPDAGRIADAARQLADY